MPAVEELDSIMKLEHDTRFVAVSLFGLWYASRQKYFRFFYSFDFESHMSPLVAVRSWISQSMRYDEGPNPMLSPKSWAFGVH